MVNITISEAKIRKSRGVVVLPVEEYYRILMVPGYQLKGKAARDLDKLVEEGLREHREGKTIKAPSISSAVRQYRSEHAR